MQVAASVVCGFWCFLWGAGCALRHYTDHFARELGHDATSACRLLHFGSTGTFPPTAKPALAVATNVKVFRKEVCTVAERVGKLVASVCLFTSAAAAAATASTRGVDKPLDECSGISSERQHVSKPASKQACIDAGLSIVPSSPLSRQDRWAHTGLHMTAQDT